MRLRNAQSGLNIAPHCIQKDQQAVYLVGLLHRGQQWHDMLIFRGLGAGWENLVSLDLAHDGQGVNGPPLRLDGGGAHIHNLLLPVGRIVAAAVDIVSRFSGRLGLVAHHICLPKARLG